MGVFFQVENKELRDLLVISKGSVKMTTEETNQPVAAAAAAEEAQEQSSQPECSEWQEKLSFGITRSSGAGDRLDDLLSVSDLYFFFIFYIKWNSVFVAKAT